MPRPAARRGTLVPMSQRLSLVVFILSLLGCSGLGGPAFEAKDGTIEDPGYFGTNAKTTCTVKNLGDAPAPATASFTLRLADGTTVTADEYVMLDPKEARPITHEFKDVRVKNKDKSTVECSVKPAE